MAEVYAALKSLQNDLSETSFRRSLQQFMAWVKGISETWPSTSRRTTQEERENGQLVFE